MATKTNPSHPRDVAVRCRSDDGRPVLVRPIAPDDADIEQEFVRGLSAEARYLRFMDTIRELSPAELARLTHLDRERELALIAVVDDDGKEKEIGVARYAVNPDGKSCEFAIVVADAWQGKGIGRCLMRRLIDAARGAGLEAMIGDILAENARMLRFVAGLGFKLSPHPEDPGLRRAVLALR